MLMKIVWKIPKCIILNCEDGVLLHVTLYRNACIEMNTAIVISRSLITCYRSSIIALDLINKDICATLHSDILIKPSRILII